MERLGEFDNKVIIEQNNEPENKNVIWKDPDENKYKEYVDGSWVESEKIATPNSNSSGLDGYNFKKIQDFQYQLQESDFDDKHEAFELVIPLESNINAILFKTSYYDNGVEEYDYENKIIALYKNFGTWANRIEDANEFFYLTNQSQLMCSFSAHEAEQRVGDIIYLKDVYVNEII